MQGEYTMRYQEIRPVRYTQTPPKPTNPADQQSQSLAIEPDAVAHARWQRLKSVDIANHAARVQPTNHDLTMAFMRYGAAQSQANQDLKKWQRRKQTVKIQQNREKIKSHQ